ncbi:IclR family transcriptional regulator C-terminal domain-containing protein [Methylocella sp. CPCC 101449]|uniref:helix-turn-helix domain-containing protein n=1 Tax=Methylocella sp. CPCC 101449 TaxID=2987531 RepID=UPI00288ED3BC|nr:IclR family transcriptional regulator C-terminal domain-containing protein [Methylocella sp. CPCC 101449]MDT2021691.1 helix-turn-helix domain-containing protein [Methylocella sp. CPCC 101449]
MDTTSKTRSLERAIDVLEHLAARGPSALHHLQDETGLSKTTLRRLLETLVRRRLVRRGLSDGAYRCNITLPSRGDKTHQGKIARLIDVATPLLRASNTDIRWPIDLHIYHQGRMQVIESTRTISPFGFNRPHRPELDLNIFAAASGISYLATLSDTRVWKMIETLRDQELWALSRYRVTPQRLFREIELTREKGYARRLANQSDGGFHAIAAPIRSHRTGIGAVSLWWPQTYLTLPAFADRHAEQLKDLAAAISREMS